MAASGVQEARSEHTEQVHSDHGRTASVRLPFVTAQFRAPTVDVGSVVRVVDRRCRRRGGPCTPEASHRWRHSR